jgi:hypothetical protein
VNFRGPGSNPRQDLQNILPYRLAQPLLPELIERQSYALQWARGGTMARSVDRRMSQIP